LKVKGQNLELGFVGVMGKRLYRLTFSFCFIFVFILAVTRALYITHVNMLGCN